TRDPGRSYRPADRRNHPCGRQATRPLGGACQPQLRLLDLWGDGDGRAVGLLRGAHGGHALCYSPTLRGWARPNDGYLWNVAYALEFDPKPGADLYGRFVGSLRIQANDF